MDSGDQLGTIVVLGGAIAVGLISFFLVVLIARRLWAWIVGEPPRSGTPKWEERGSHVIEAIQSSGVTASDLFIIRSNLNAVSRQIEDLERRLRLNSAESAKVVNLPRK